jgi:hypothetical protein
MPITTTNWRSFLLAALLLGQFAVRGELSLRQESPVWDERLHVGYGLALLDNGPDFDGQDHPYLMAAALSVPTWLHLPGPNRYAQGNVDDPEVLRPARRLNLALATLALGLLALFASRRHGAGFALLVLGVATLDPSWLAQARYATTDIGHALGWWLAACALWQHQRDPRWRWLLLAGAGLALGLASKWSTLALPALVPLVWLGEKNWRSAWPAALLTFVLGLVFLLVPFLLLALWHHVPLASALGHVYNGLHASTLRRSAARGVYLLGSWWPDGTRWYFPALLLAKTPVALLVLAAIGAAWRREFWRHDRGWLLLLLGYLAVAIAAKQNLGHRHLTPLLPVLWWLAAGALLALWQHRLRWTAPVLAGALAVEVLVVHPHYLPFTNGLFGGMDAVPPVVVDSAADWGQALPDLAAYVHAHPVDRLDLAYFGNADPLRYLAQPVWRSCGVLGRGPVNGQARADVSAPYDLLAVSATCIYGGAGMREGGKVDLTRRDDAWANFRGRVPDAILDGSIYLFRGHPGANTNGH